MNQAIGNKSERADRFRAFKEAYLRGNQAWNEGDFRRAYGGLPEGFHYELSRTWPQARPLQGLDEIAAFFEEFRETFPDARTGAPEFIEVDDSTMLAGFRVTGSGRSSGADTEMEIWQVWRFDDRVLPVEVTEFSDLVAALQEADAGEARERQG